MKLSWIGIVGVGLIVLALILAAGAYFLGYFQSPEAAARANLKAALDGWIAQTPPEKFQQTHPEIAFGDANFMDKKLLRYDIVSPGAREDGFMVFTVKLTVQKDDKELEFPRTYKVGRVKTPSGEDVWAIAGHTK